VYKQTLDEMESLKIAAIIIMIKLKILLWKRLMLMIQTSRTFAVPRKRKFLDVACLWDLRKVLQILFVLLMIILEMLGLIAEKKSDTFKNFKLFFHLGWYKQL
jgi:hypothetical protein